MSRVLPRLHALCYWRLRCLFRAYLDDGYDAFKALVIIGGVQVCLAFSLFSGVSLVLGRRPLSFSGFPGVLAIGFLAIVIAVADSLRSREWVTIESEFERMNASARRWTTVAVILGPVVVVAGTLFLASAASRLPVR